MKKFFKQKNNGFTLVETLVAISIFTMSILGLMSILASGITDTTYAKQKMVASYLAQEGIEYARNARDTKILYPAPAGQTSQDMWNAFRENTYTITGFPIYSDSSFSRSVTKTKINDNEVKITSSVSWTQGSGPQSITFSENLFNWVQ